MSSDSKQENAHQKTDEADDNETSPYQHEATKSLTFKDWKNMKESKDKSNEKKLQNNGAKTATNDKRDGRNNYNNNGFNGARGFHGQGGQNFFTGNNYMSSSGGGGGGFMPNNNFNNYNGMNNFNNNFGFRGNNYCGYNGNGFNNFNTLNNNNNYNRQNNLNGNNNNSFNNNFCLNNPFAPNSRNNFNGNNMDLPDNFFASDGIYRQKDLMQKPLLNPFRNEQRGEQLLQEFDKSRYTKGDKKKKKGNNNKVAEAKDKPKKDAPQISNEPQVFILNPKSNKTFIPKPKVPEKNLEITREEKKQQWKEYREAMKPFKNREFYNAKRVVQRLGKKAPEELEEKEVIRLMNAREIMAAHKAHLTAKYANYVKTDDNSNGLGELYVLKKTPLARTDFGKAREKQLQNYGNFGENHCNNYNDFEAGRKIVGGYGGFRDFVPGGILRGTFEKLSTQ